MPIVAEEYCPYCKRKIVIENNISYLPLLGVVILHKVEDYKKKIGLK